MHLARIEIKKAEGLPRARSILVDWTHHRPLFRKVAPKGAAPYVAIIRSAYLTRGETGQREPALVR